MNPFHPHLTSPSRGRNPFLPSQFWEGSGEGILEGAPQNTGSLNSSKKVLQDGWRNRFDTGCGLGLDRWPVVWKLAERGNATFQGEMTDGSTC